MHTANAAGGSPTLVGSVRTEPDTEGVHVVVDARRWFTGYLEDLLRRAGSPSLRALADSTKADTSAPDSVAQLARRAGMEHKPLAHSTVHDLLKGKGARAPDSWTVSMFVLACLRWGHHHGSPVLPELSPAAVRRELEEWQRRRNDYEDLLHTRLESPDGVSAPATGPAPSGRPRAVTPGTGFFGVLVTDPREASTVYAGMTEGTPFYRSDDGGRSWTAASTGLAVEDVRGLAVSHFDSRVFAATDQGVWHSDDRGSTWNELLGWQDRPLLSVAVSPHDSGLLLVGCQRPGGVSVQVEFRGRVGPVGHEGTANQGLKISRDDGGSWTTLPGPENVNDIWVDPHDSRVFALASAENGVYLSRDHVENLQRVSTFPKRRRPACVALLPDDTRTILVGTLGSGLYRSTDGVTWERAEGVPDVQVSAIEVVSEEPLLVLAPTPVGPFTSEDGGRTWRPHTVGLDYAYAMTATTSDGTVVLGTSGGGAFRWTPGRQSWNPARAGLPAAGAGFLHDAGGGVLAAGSVTALISRDKGASWRFAGPDTGVTAITSAGILKSAAGNGLLRGHTDGGPPSPVAVAGAGGVELVVGTHCGQLLRSVDSGSTWTSLASPDNRHHAIRSVLLHPSRPDHIGVLVEHRGFFLSQDGGTTWPADPQAVLGERVHLVTACRGTDQWFALTDRGVLHSEDGSSWRESTGIPPGDDVTALTATDDPQTRYAATTDLAVYRSTDAGRTFDRLGGPSPPDSRLDDSQWTSLAVRTSLGGPSTLVLGSAAGIQLSQDEGVTWETFAEGIRVNDLLMLGSTLLVAARDGIFTFDVPRLSGSGG